mmetsp:Transcript_38760/g.102324  ORF Transcript_38760/g.102324 Transcript_38760/m.102324 type:complete len:286 (+) Transcript_38760:96-953(+)
MRAHGGLAPPVELVASWRALRGKAVWAPPWRGLHRGAGCGAAAARIRGQPSAWRARSLHAELGEGVSSRLADNLIAVLQAFHDRGQMCRGVLRPLYHNRQRLATRCTDVPICILQGSSDGLREVNSLVAHLLEGVDRSMPDAPVVVLEALCHSRCLLCRTFPELPQGAERSAPDVGLGVRQAIHDVVHMLSGHLRPELPQGLARCLAHHAVVVGKRLRNRIGMALRSLTHLSKRVAGCLANIIVTILEASCDLLNVCRGIAHLRECDDCSATHTIILVRQALRYL